LALGLATALLGSAGCTLALGYPPVADDETGDLCANGRDDDLDGVIDCAERACASTSCVEASDASCGNGWDDDVDGLPDAIDPGCWSHARFAVRRCAPIGPTSFAPSFDSLDTGWRQTAGTAPTLEDDPLHPGMRIARTPTVTMLVSEPMAGSTSGLVMTFDFVPALDAISSIGLTRHPGVRAYSPDGLAVLVDHGRLAIATSSLAFGVPWEVMPGERLVGRIELTPRTAADGTPMRPLLHVTIGSNVFEGEFAFPGVGPGEAPAPIADGAALSAFYLTDGGPDALLGAVHVELPAFNPCITDGSDPSSPVIGHAPLGVARSDGLTCFLSRDAFGDAPTRRVVARRSHDDGLHWDAPSVVLDLDALGLPPGLAAIDVPITRDSEDFVGVAMIGNLATRETTTRLVRSADCETWSIADTGLDPSLPFSLLATGTSYVVHGSEHEIWSVDLPTLEDAVILRAASVDGTPSSFRFAPEVTPMPWPPMWADFLFDGTRVVRVGGDLVLTYGGAASIEAYVADAAGHWSAVPESLVTASEIPGTIDEAEIVTAHTFFDAPTTDPDGTVHLTGVIAYGGELVGTCPESCDVTSIVQTFEVVPR
jgi:hypothetical protein